MTSCGLYQAFSEQEALHFSFAPVYIGIQSCSCTCWQQHAYALQQMLHFVVPLFTGVAFD